MNGSQRKMILDWLRKVHQLEYAHRLESISWSWLAGFLEYCVLILATTVTFSYQFPPLPVAEYEELHILLRRDVFIPLASFVVAILTAISTLLRPGKKTEKHRVLGAKYETLRHDLETIITRNPRVEDLPEILGAWQEDWSAMGAPNVSQWNFRRGKAKAKSLNKYPEELSFLDDIESES